MKLISILSSLVATVVLSAGVAQADTRAIYTISGISVDREAATTREAEAEAFAEAKIIGLQSLIRKITLPEDRANMPGGFYTFANANALAAAVDVDNEKRSTTVYRADLSVVYNPTRVRSALRQAGIPYVDQASALSLVAPVSSNSNLVNAWWRSWPTENSGALNPYVTGLALYSPGANWTQVSEEVNRVNASNAVLAELMGGEGNYRVRLVRVTGNGNTTIGVTGAVATMGEAVEAASSYLDATWKRQAVVRGSERSQASASLYYNDLKTWTQLRSALSNSPLVSEFQVEAISRDGAYVTFSYAGNESRLASELRQRGVTLSQDGRGFVMRSSLGAPS